MGLEELGRIVASMDPDLIPDPDRLVGLSVEQRQEFHFEGRTPTPEDLDDGEVFDPVTGGYVTSGWVPPAVIVDEDLDEDVD